VRKARSSPEPDRSGHVPAQLGGVNRSFWLRTPAPPGQRHRTARPMIPDILDEQQNAPICVPQLRSVERRPAVPNGGSGAADIAPLLVATTFQGQRPQEVLSTRQGVGSPGANLADDNFERHSVLGGRAAT